MARNKTRGIKKAEVDSVKCDRKKRGRKKGRGKKVNEFLPEFSDTPSMIKNADDISKIRRVSSIYDGAIHPHAAFQLCAEHGMTRKQLARIFGVSLKTVEMWITKHPDFKEAVLTGRDSFDTLNVEQMLLKRAMGFEYTERVTKRISVSARDGEGLEVTVPATETTLHTKYVVPDVKAATFWLTNRNKERWQLIHKIQAELKTKTSHTELQITANIEQLSKMDFKQLKQLREMVAQSADDNGTAIPVECIGEGGTDDKTLQIEHFMDAAAECVEDEEGEED